MAMASQNQARLTLPPGTSITSIAQTFDEVKKRNGDIYNIPGVKVIKGNLDRYFFDCMTIDKTKTIEGRPNKEKWKEVCVGTILEFSRQNDDKEIEPNPMYCIVTNIFFYHTFRELLLQEGMKRILPGLTSLEEGETLYKTWYSLIDQLKFGVVGFECALLYER